MARFEPLISREDSASWSFWTDAMPLMQFAILMVSVMMTSAFPSVSVSVVTDPLVAAETSATPVVAPVTSPATALAAATVIADAVPQEDVAAEAPGEAEALEEGHPAVPEVLLAETEEDHHHPEDLPPEDLAHLPRDLARPEDPETDQGDAHYETSAQACTLYKK